MKNVWIKKFLLFVLVLVLLRVVCGWTGSGIYSDRDDKSVSIKYLSENIHKEHIWIPVQLHTSDTANTKIWKQIKHSKNKNLQMDFHFSWKHHWNHDFTFFLLKLLWSHFTRYSRRGLSKMRYHQLVKTHFIFSFGW